MFQIKTKSPGHTKRIAIREDLRETEKAREEEDHSGPRQSAETGIQYVSFFEARPKPSSQNRDCEEVYDTAMRMQGRLGETIGGSWSTRY